MKKFDLEERLIDYSVQIVKIAGELPKSKVGNHLSGQLISIFVQSVKTAKKNME